NLDEPWPRIGCLPPAVRSGAGHLRKTSWPHLSVRDQRFGLRAVDLRPFAARRPRDEPLAPMRLVDRLHLPVDPAVSERGFERLIMRDAGLTGALFREQYPDSCRAGVVVVQP